jgi:hypothetical protein
MHGRNGQSRTYAAALRRLQVGKAFLHVAGGWSDSRALTTAQQRSEEFPALESSEETALISIGSKVHRRTVDRRRPNTAR